MISSVEKIMADMVTRHRYNVKIHKFANDLIASYDDCGFSMNEYYDSKFGGLIDGLEWTVENDIQLNNAIREIVNFVSEKEMKV